MTGQQELYAQQGLIDARFWAEANDWSELYDREDTFGDILRQRLKITLDWARALRRDGRSRALDVGCGAGQAAVKLTHLGWRTEATDRLPVMLQQVRAAAQNAGIVDQVGLGAVDARALAFRDASFDLVICLGVIMWLSPGEGEQFIAEVARVLRPGGYCIVHAINPSRLDFFLDPAFNPVLAPVRSRVRKLRGRSVGGGGAQQAYSSVEFDRQLERSGLEPLAHAHFGFGPFTILGRPCLPVTLDRWIANTLDLATRVLPPLNGLTGHYLVMARHRQQTNAPSSPTSLASA